MGELGGLLWALTIEVPLLILAVWLDVKRRRRMGREPAQGPGKGDPGYLAQSEIDNLPTPGIRRPALRTEPRDERLEIGFADPGFADVNGRVDLKDVNVLIIDGMGMTIRELIVPISRHRSLMLAARGIDEDMLATLIANRKGLMMPLAAVITDLILEVAGLTDALLVSVADFRTGYLSAGHPGHATRWVTDGARTWVEPHPPLARTM